MTQTEALRLALKALEEIHRGNMTPMAEESWNKAITAIKAALEANEFNPDWDTQAVLVEEIQRMAKRIEELEAKVEPFGFFQYDIRLDAWVQNRINNKGVAFFIKGKNNE